jgi:hypothetical protein
VGNLKPIEYEAHVKKLLDALVERFNWEPMMEGENIIGRDARTPGGVSLDWLHALPGEPAATNWRCLPYALLGLLLLHHSRVSAWLRGPYRMSSIGVLTAK